MNRDQELYSLKYGCNPHQGNAKLYSVSPEVDIPFKILNGSPGYINILDAVNSWYLVNEILYSINKIASASFKHVSPSGVAIGETVLDSYRNARECDPKSSFGDFIAINSEVTKELAMYIKTKVSDGIIAKDYTPEALRILSKKKKGKYIILKGNSNINNINNNSIEYREIFGLALAQKVNTEKVDDSYFTNIPTIRNELQEHKKEDLILATTTLKYTPSNSIVVSNNYQVIGVGAGQQNRVDCIKIAGSKALTFNMRFHPKCIELIEKFKPEVKRQDKVNAIIKYIHNDFLYNELVRWRDLFTEPDTIELFTEKEKLIFQTDLSELCLSSDAFFPFRDNIDYAQRYGVSYILNPGGSIQDDNVIDACDEYNILMAISGKRMFYH